MDKEIFSSAKTYREREFEYRVATAIRDGAIPVYVPLSRIEYYMDFEFLVIHVSVQRKFKDLIDFKFKMNRMDLDPWDENLVWAYKLGQILKQEMSKI